MPKTSRCPFMFWQEIPFEKCPFLRCLSTKLSADPELLQDYPSLQTAENFYDTYEYFHGSQGTLPLEPHQYAIPEEEKGAKGAEEGFSTGSNFLTEERITCGAMKLCDHVSFRSRAAVLPFATISFTTSFPQNAPGDGEHIGRNKDQRIADLEIRGHLPSKGDPQSAKPSGQSIPKRNSPPSKAHVSSTPGKPLGQRPEITVENPSHVIPQSAVYESKCPLSKIPVVKHLLGDMLLPVRTVAGGKTVKLECPAPVVRLRAAFAATRPMRALRPQKLPVRIMAVAGTSFLTNVPLGAWREHVVKFSPEWFVAIHASIPLVILMRKGALLPQYAIIATIGSAILGQLVGSRTERKRVHHRSAAITEHSSQSASCGQNALLSTPNARSLALGLPPLAAQIAAY